MNQTELNTMLLQGLKDIAYAQTYLKGINPQSVEKMHTVLKLEQEFEDDGFFSYNGITQIGKQAVRLLKTLREEVLTASKLPI